MNGESRRSRGKRVEAAGTSRSTIQSQRQGRIGLIAVMLAIATCAMMAGCAVAGPASHSEGTSSTHLEDGDDMTSGDDGASVQEVSFDQLTADPQSFVGSRIRVTGNVFFHSVCPPPGATDAPCVLLGYLTDPEQRTFIAADESRALALAEGGSRLSCEESVASGRACPGWSADSTYTLEGVLEHQVLGGRETDLVQLDVETKGEPQAW